MTFPNIQREPDSISFLISDEVIPKIAVSASSDRLVWESDGIRLELQKISIQKTSIIVESKYPLRRITIRWNHAFLPGTVLLGDAWERSYGDLGWRGYSIVRPMPWYFLVSNQSGTAGYGVETGASSMAYWQTDGEGVTLHLDTRCGGVGVELKGRQLQAAKIISITPLPDEAPYHAAHRLCRALCPNPLMPAEPIIGHNDWYWLYGKSTEIQILDATKRFLDLYPKNKVIRPWSVIDDGWQVLKSNTSDAFNGGPWDSGNRHFPDMGTLAQKIEELGARPGIWLRPLLTLTSVPGSWRLPLSRQKTGEVGILLDPSVPDVLEQVASDVRRLVGWGYEMIKHDFSTFDITGRWGFDMNGSNGVTDDGWSFSDRSHTTAEIVLNLYRTIRDAAGSQTLLIGCNTIGHLSAGIMEIQRTGDDTSAYDWDRTLRMGVNTLAFRGTQHGAFHSVDADCVPVGLKIPWNLTASWLDLVAKSGTPLFLSIDPAALGKEQKEAIHHALKTATEVEHVAEPLDWMETDFPREWRFHTNHEQTEKNFQWIDR